MSSQIVPSFEPVPKPGYGSQTRTYKLITPLFGGGVMPHHPDPITVVKTSSIRGQLRFWWRVTRGGGFSGNLAAMRKREEEIWGSAASNEKPGLSKVRLSVVPIQRGQPLTTQPTRVRGTVQAVSIGDPRTQWGYGAFPLKKEKGSVQDGIVLELQIEFPVNESEEIEVALKAWETFGGVGARTRRGFGAIQLFEIDHTPVVPPSFEETQKWAASLMQGEWPFGVPRLKDWIPVVKPGDNSRDVHLRLIKALKEFRQHRSGEGGFGTSNWPEPNAIRLAATEYHKEKQYSKHKPQPGALRRFPRAKFGLPIVFQFKETVGENPTEPEVTSLQGNLSDRLASPLVMRPLLLQEGVVGSVLYLAWDRESAGAPPGGIAIYQGKNKIGDVQADLTSTEANFEPLKGNSDVVEAFLMYLRKMWKQL